MIKLGKYDIKLQDGEFLTILAHQSKTVEGYEVFSRMANDWNDQVDVRPEIVHEHWVNREDIKIVEWTEYRWDRS